MDYINSIETQRLKGIIAIYNNDLRWHGITNNGSIKVAQPLSQDNVNLLAELTKEQAQEETKEYFIDFISPNILHYKTNERHIIWYSEPKQQPLLFSKDLPIESANYPIPYLLWSLQGDTLKVYALKNKPQSANAPLFMAPFLNVYNTGAVCMGSASLKHKSTDYKVLIPFCQYAFFNSTFTHTNCDRILKRNISDVYQEQFLKKTKTFNHEILLPNNNQLKIKDLF